MPKNFFRRKIFLAYSIGAGVEIKCRRSNNKKVGDRVLCKAPDEIYKKSTRLSLMCLYLSNKGIFPYFQL